MIVKVIDLFTAGLSYEDGCYTLRYSKGFSLHAVVIRRGGLQVRIGQSSFKSGQGGVIFIFTPIRREDRGTICGT